MLGPRNGNRSSVLLKNRALPPSGNPVGCELGPPGTRGAPVSRGPAWLNGNARSESDPPPKKRSGSGTDCASGSPAGADQGLITPKLVCLARIRLRVRRWYV